MSAQFDLTATPKHTNGAIFPQTISDYPLVEAIAQSVVKTPVLPDAASRARLTVRQSDDFVEQYQDHLDLGVLEWRRSYDELAKAGKKSVLFVMTTDTANCDRVADWLQERHPDLKGKVLLNKVTGDNPFELAFAAFLEAASDVQAFYKNSEATGFTIEYQAAGGGIVRDYRPDFIARESSGTIWIIETKGREDLNDPRKWERLKLWCDDANAQDAPRRYRALFVREEAWGSLLNPVRTLAEAQAAFGE